MMNVNACVYVCMYVCVSLHVCLSVCLSVPRCEVPRRFSSRVELCDSLTECTSPPPFYHHLCEAVATLPFTLASDGETLVPWLQAIPSVPKFVLKPSEFQLGSSLRLGIPLPFSQVITQCDCGACLDEHGYHLLT